MNPIEFPKGVETVLCVGAHCDDIEIGCGGTLLELSLRNPETKFHWAIFSGEDERASESHRAASVLLGAKCQVDVQQFRASYLRHDGVRVKDHFESALKPLKPDLIFTHYLNDRHQDHSFLSELTWNTFRNHVILEYEIPKYEGDLGHPNFYASIGIESMNRKVDMLMECFPSQYSRTWFSRDVFQSYMRLKGIECNAASGYAEAFHARKLVM